MDTLIALSILISMSLAFSLMVARVVRTRTIHQVITIVNKQAEDIANRIQFNNDLPHSERLPFDWELEERFDSIVKEFKP